MPYLLGTAALLFWPLATGPLLPASTLDWTARVRDIARDPLPDDPQAAEEIRLGYRLFVETPRQANHLSAASLSCGSCHLNAGQKEGAIPLIGVAKVYPEYNQRAGRKLTLEERVVG